MRGKHIDKEDSLGGILGLIKPALNVVATAGQIASLIQSAASSAEEEEREMVRGLGCPPPADLGPIALVQQQSGVFAFNMSDQQNVGCQITNPLDPASALMFPIDPGKKVNLSTFIFDSGVPSTTPVEFSTLPSSISLVGGQGSDPHIFSCHLDSISINSVKAVGKLKFMLTARQLAMFGFAAATMCILRNFNCRVSGGSGQEFRYDISVGDKMKPESSDHLGSGEQPSWTFDLPDLADYSIDRNTPMDVNFSIQYNTDDTGLAHQPGVAMLDVGDHEMEALLRLRDKRRRDLAQ